MERIERVRTDKIETIGSHRVVQYRGGALPLFDLSRVADFGPLPERTFQEVIVFKVRDREVGLMVSPPVDAVEIAPDLDASALKQPGISGSMTINGRTTLLIDIFDMVKALFPDWFAGRKGENSSMGW